MLSTLLAAMIALTLSPAWGQEDLRRGPDASPAWEATLDRVVPAVVSIKVNATRAFDTESAGSSVATGFVIDAERGLILTNRHVVQPGPVVARAIFQNHEEVELQPLYRDPVHDFGIFRFDPAQVRFMEVQALRLAPEKARVGAEIRVVGNDAGEKISILAGTLARLDRDAPDYGRFRFNDFNTFYYQAASGTSGGSSGSPVIDRDGHVIALNAGSRRAAASSYFLPLDRVVRAVRLLQAGQPVPRGTWQVTLLHKPYDELRRLGLSSETEARLRRAQPKGTGMLVVEGVVPGGPAQERLELGDVLLEVEGELITGFAQLEGILDERVEAELAVRVERGGQPVDLALTVQDLHEITPSSYLEVGDAVLNELSYQQARHALVPVGGAYVAASGYMLGAAGIGARAVLTAIGDQAVYSLDDAQAAFAGLADGDTVPVRWFTLDDPWTTRVGVVTMDRRWFSMTRCTWDVASGGWPCAEAAPPPPSAPWPVASTTFPREESRLENRLGPSLVQVGFDVPYRVEGVYGSNFVGTGVILDTERGLVAVDRDTVPIALGDVRLVFAGSIELPGEVVHLHPLHNVAIIRYDPRLLGDTPARAARLRTTPLAPGDRTWHVGLDRRNRVVSRKTRVQRVDPLVVPMPNPPFFRDQNVEVVDVREAAPSSGGVLADRRGRVQALWASFVDLSGEQPEAWFRGLPAGVVAAVLDPLRQDRVPVHRALGVDLAEIGLVDARNRGLGEDAARLLEEAGGANRRALVVTRVWADAPARTVLREGDLLVRVEGAPAVGLRAIDQAARAEQVTLQVVRDGQELTLVVPTVARDGGGITRVVSWAGTLLHPVHDAVPTQRGLSRQGVYVAWYWYGSPAAQYDLRATRRILEVNDQPTPDLDSFLAAVQAVPDGGAVRLKTEDLDGRVEVKTLVVDLTWWPTWELVRTDAGWQRRALPAG
ncbi:trypsin-like peptidase domain-containing protein [Myxococcota bacterium]|nr:trypsin-like peptidase domain-containing protein [Myxococcota bacterium]